MSGKVTIVAALLNRKKYYCLAPFERSFGNFAEDLYYGLMSARLNGKKLVVIARKPGTLRKFLSKFKRDRFTNKELFELECPGLIVPHRDIIGYDLFAGFLDHLYIFFFLIKVVVRKLTGFDLFFHPMFHNMSVLEMPRFGQGRIFTPDGAKSFSWETDRSYGWDKLMREEHILQLEDKKKKLAESARVRMGLPLDAEYVGIHVRDGGYYAEQGFLGSFRNADIANYEQAVDAAISRGLWVVRLGDPGMKPAPFKRERFIDYPFTSYRTDLLDLYLYMNCKIYMGTDSGASEVAMMFQRDMILTDVTNFSHAFPVRFGGLGVIKYFYSKSRKRFLSISELLEEPYLINLPFHPPETEEATDYIIFDSTPEDLRIVMEERLDQGQGYVYSDLQNEFLRKRKEQCKQWVASDPHYINTPRESYFFASRMYYRSTVGREFLKRYWNYGEELKQLTAEFHQTGRIHRRDHEKTR